MNNEFEISALAEAVQSGDRRALAKAITLVESTHPDHRIKAESLLATLPVPDEKSVRLGITGSPGVGKSTFIEAFGSYLTSQERRVAVLAVDPSSSRSGGSILGDKTRMATLARDPRAFIRPTPAGRSLGGVAKRTREAMTLVEAAGFDVIIVETVGVGQSEYAVADMVDMFILLVAPGGGDELQGIKRGIMELADLLVVNKADGVLEKAANNAATEYKNAASLMRPRMPWWTVEVLTASALQDIGLPEIWHRVEEFHEKLAAHSDLNCSRAAQAQRWLWEEIQDNFVAAIKSDSDIAPLIAELEQQIIRHEITPTAAARGILEKFLARPSKP